MRKNRKKRFIAIWILVMIILTTTNVTAHSGRTDSSGGHKDKNNVSGLGSYHYHCGGHPAHLHKNGVCPYSSSKSSQSSSTSSSRKEEKEKPTTIEATNIQINESMESIEVGERKALTTTITPENVTNKEVFWKSSDESIVEVTAEGEVIAKKAGTVEIVASTTNEKTSMITVNIIEKPKVENTQIQKLATVSQNNTISDSKEEEKEKSNPLGGILVLGILGFLGYKILKKK